MLRKLLYCSVFTLLCTSFDLLSQNVAPELSAALCEIGIWESQERSERDSLLRLKADYLIQANAPSKAFETISRIPSYGISPEQRAELIRLKLKYSYEAGMIEDFTGLLEDAYVSGALEEVTPEGRPRHRSESAAFILSAFPGAGLAYVGDWKNAGKHFLLNGAVIALGVGTFTSGLYLATFLGGGMLLYHTLPVSSALAESAAAKFNSQALLDYYRPVYDAL